MHKRSFQSPVLKHFDFMILSIVSYQLAYILAYWIRFGIGNPYKGNLLLAILLTSMDIIVVIGGGILKGITRRGYLMELEKCLFQFILFIMICSSIFYITKTGEHYSRVLVMLSGALATVFNYVSRVIYKKVLMKILGNRRNQSIYILVDDADAARVVENLDVRREGMTIKGIVVLDKDRSGEMIGGYPVIACRESAANYICQRWVDAVYVKYPIGDTYPYELLNNLVLMGVTIYQDILASTVVKGNVKFWDTLGGHQVLTTSIGTMTAGQAVLKRTMDIVGGIVGCIFTGLIYLLIAPKIKRESPGPVFFKQPRVGRNGKVFMMYKFRSMYLDAEERKKELIAQNRVKDGMMFKLDFDPRIIGSKKLPDGTIQKGIGNKIRDWSIDEFPQFWNVLKGEMSLVGTRPPTLDEWQKYQYHHRARMAMKPGITGMWQTSGRSNITDFEEVVRLDTEYITNWSFHLDIKIMLKTVLVALKKEGSM